MTEVADKMFKLTSSEGEEFDVPRSFAKLSSKNSAGGESSLLLITVDLGMDDESMDAPNPIPLPNVNTATLRKVIDWCAQHKDDAPVDEDAEKKDKKTDNIPQWDQKFFNVELSFLFELILAANYLDIKGMLDIGCKTVANMIKTFHIENDFTPEEEEQIRKENAWCED